MDRGNFMEMLRARWAQGKFICVGLDSDSDKIPASLRRHDVGSTLIDFSRAIAEATADLVCAFKPNSAFYERHGFTGISALKVIIDDLHAIAPEVPVILDAKRADIGNTNIGYVKMVFDYLQADAVTVHPYLGAEALEPFLDRADKGVFVLCRTSNPGAGEFQDLEIEFRAGTSGSEFKRLYQVVAHSVASNWNKNGNCGLVVGATYPDELRKVRELVGDIPILIPGIGAQGGDLEATVAAGKNSSSQGMIINSSRGIIFASSGPDFAEAARRETERLHNLVNRCLAVPG